MIKPKHFFDTLLANNIDFFTGVPDSLLKNFLTCLKEHTTKEQHIVAANEGGAIGLAIGNYLATSKLPLVYMQNSGIGNTINPLLSLADEEVYAIPLLLLIGWRGEPNIKDEPQHIKQGKVSLDLLRSMQIPYEIIDAQSDYKKIISKQAKLALKESKPVAIVIRKNTFERYTIQKKEPNGISRESAIKTIVDELGSDDIIVSTTGKASRELFEYRFEKKQGHANDFLTVGGMGHASSIALGIALETKDRTVVCLDGDGAALMHLGSMGIIASMDVSNYLHIILNNEAHDSVGGQPTIGGIIDFKTIAKGLGYSHAFSVQTEAEIKRAIQTFKKNKKLTLIEIKVKKGARKELGRPTTSPKENKVSFMNLLK